MPNLPEVFLSRMKTLLGFEYDEFISAMSDKSLKGLRLNTLKCNRDTLEGHLKLSPSPFSPLAYFAEESLRPGRDPFHAAGAYYMQEPSASSAVTILDPKPGDFVLDMCAAPGGKSTQIATLLKGKGLLWSNEVVKQRANILISNIERMGIKNAVVSSAFPEIISKKLTEFFDKVIVDAPCSGEGMFRKDETAITEWSEEHVISCAQRQSAILDCAAKVLKPGGILVYSTCTFSTEENEGTVTTFLESHSDFTLEPIDAPFGRKAFGMDALRIFPMDNGEGHFVAKLKKSGELIKNSNNSDYIYQRKNNSFDSKVTAFIKDNFNFEVMPDYDIIGENIYLIPKELPDIRALGVLRAGVKLGIIKGNRIEPEHAIYMSLKPDECTGNIDFSPDDKELLAFYHGEEIDCDIKGYVSVSVSGIITGFGKASGGRLKNKYPKGLRWQ